MKTIVMALWHSADTLDGADYAALEITTGIALELLSLIARHREELAKDKRLCAVLYRDVHIPTFFKDFEGYGDRDGTLGEVLHGLHAWQDDIAILEGRLEVPNGEERSLEYPKLWVQADRVFWRGSYRHEEVTVETMPVLQETLQQIAGVKRC